MRLGEMWVGKLDGKDTFLDETPALFNTFVLPPSVKLTRLLNRESQFVVGLRGVGKTSILRYVAREMTDDAISGFILFKSDITESDREKISRNVWFSKVSSNEFAISQDFKESWRWFLVFRICEILLESGRISPEDELVSILGVRTPWYRQVLGYFPKLTSGNIRIETDGLPFLKGAVGLEFDDAGSSVSLESVNRRVEKLISQIPIEKKVYIFVDELEVFYESPEQYSRDKLLVRDLLFVIKKLNDLFRNSKVPIYLIAAVRTEVLASLSVSGQEIERSVDDNAEKVFWHQGVRSPSHPLINIIRRYLRYNLEISGDFREEGVDLFREFFPEKINRSDPHAYILDNSFYKPRDIVARMSAAKSFFPDRENFTQEVIERSQGEYGKLLLREVRYELGAIYRPDELNVIESLFRAKEAFFDAKKFEYRLEEMSRYSSIAAALRRCGGVDLR